MTVATDRPPPGGTMTYETFNAYCGGLADATYVNQWGGAHVWKVAGKVFAVGGWNRAGIGIVFKVTEIAFEILKDRPGLRPAPYLASRGLHWIQHYEPPGLPDDELLDFVRMSHSLVLAARPGGAKTAHRSGRPHRVQRKGRR